MAAGKRIGDKKYARSETKKARPSSLF